MPVRGTGLEASRGRRFPRLTSGSPRGSSATPGRPQAHRSGRRGPRPDRPPESARRSGAPQHSAPTAGPGRPGSGCAEVMAITGSSRRWAGPVSATRNAAADPCQRHPGEGTREPQGPGRRRSDRQAPAGLRAGPGIHSRRQGHQGHRPPRTRQEHPAPGRQGTCRAWTSHTRPGPAAAEPTTTRKTPTGSSARCGPTSSGPSPTRRREESSAHRAEDPSTHSPRPPPQPSRHSSTNRLLNDPPGRDGTAGWFVAFRQV